MTNLELLEALRTASRQAEWRLIKQPNGTLTRVPSNSKDKPVTTTKTPTACACGCGETTARQFAAGHDNRLYGQVRRGERPESDLDPYPGLVRKLDRAKWNDGRKAERKTEAATVEAVTKPSDDKFADATQVKVGRWTYEVESTEVLDDGLVRVEFRTKDGTVKAANVPPRALS